MQMPPETLLPGPQFSRTIDIDALKSVHTDVDNTLVGNNSKELPSDRFVEAAHTASELGHRTVALATARQLEKVEHILQVLQTRGVSILSNGGQLFSGRAGEVVVERPIAQESAVKIARNLQAMDVKHWIQDNGIDHTWSGEVVNRRDSLGRYNKENVIWKPGSSISPMRAYIPHKPFAIIASDVNGADIEQVIDMVKAEGDENTIAFLGHENSKPNGSTTYEVFILDKRGTKRHALLQAAELQGTELAEMAAIGDGPNDAVLLETAGVGIAVNNAVAETKQVATFIAPSQEDDGAAIALEYITRNGQ